MARKKAEYPLCEKYELLRKTGNRSRTKGSVISTTALYYLLGNKRYQQVCEGFEYSYSSGPDPASVEEFLRDHFQ